MVQIHRDVTGWTAFLKQGLTWEITLPNGRHYAIYNQRDGLVKAIHIGKKAGSPGRPLGRVQNVQEALVVARATYRVNQNDDR